MRLPKEERMNYAAYCQLPDDGKRYEIIDGEAYVTPAPVWDHQSSVSQIILAIGPWLRAHDLGRMLPSPLDVILDDETIVQPDLVFIRKERIPRIVAKAVHGAPDLVIEILSPSTASRDQLLKRRTYAAYGVPEYWIVDTDARSVTVLSLRGNHYVKLGAAVGDRPIPSRVLDGLPALATDFF